MNDSNLSRRYLSNLITGIGAVELEWDAASGEKNTQAIFLKTHCLGRHPRNAIGWRTLTYRADNVKTVSVA
jgi:hypothetical protein